MTKEAKAWYDRYMALIDRYLALSDFQSEAFNNSVTFSQIEGVLNNGAFSEGARQCFRDVLEQGLGLEVSVDGGRWSVDYPELPFC